MPSSSCGDHNTSPPLGTPTSVGGGGGGGDDGGAAAAPSSALEASRPPVPTRPPGSSLTLVLARLVPPALRKAFCWNMQCGVSQCLFPTDATAGGGGSSSGGGFGAEFQAQLSLQQAKRRREAQRVGAHLSCSRCKLVSYCSKECQREAWGKGGHKGECEYMARIAGSTGSLNEG